MSDFLEAIKLDELKDGTMRAVNVAGHEILLARVKDKYLAADNRCPHMGGNLSHGSLEKTVVTCPLHGSQFDLKDGRVVLWTNWSGIKLAMGNLFKPPKPIKIYKVKIEGDKVLIEI